MSENHKYMRNKMQLNVVLKMLGLESYTNKLRKSFSKDTSKLLKGEYVMYLVLTFPKELPS